MKNILRKIGKCTMMIFIIIAWHHSMRAQTFPTPGFTLPNGKTIIITYDVDVNANACPDGSLPSANISNQSNVSGSNFTTVQTDDPDIAGPSNPTLTTFGALTLGDLVYKDNNNSGVFDGGDAGINGVLLLLYLDNGDGVLTVADGAALTTTTSAGGGLYLFNPICPGNYIVEVAASNFNIGGALYDNGLMSPLLSSPVGGATDPDNDVNNDDNGDPVTGFGVASQAITVGYGAEPTTDGDALSNTNLSLDFGFREPTTIAINDVTMNEGTGGSTTSFNFIVTRSNNEAAFSLTVNTNDGTASAIALDYTDIINGTIMFTEGGSLTQTVTILVNHDNIVETGETFTVLITSPPAGTIIIDGSGLGTITNDDAAVVTLSGGTSHNEGTSFDFTATLNNPVQDGFNVLYTTNDGTALTSDNDYTDNDGPALIFSGTAGESHTITVNSTADNKVELNETFTVALVGLTGAPTAVTIVGSSQSGTITNDDDAVVVIAGNVSQSEAITPQVFSVTLSNPVDVNVTVQFSTSNGSATTADNDYTGIVGQTVTFIAGSTTTQTVNVAIIPDTKVETDEMYNVAIGTLSAGAPMRNVTLGTSTGTGTIINDDSAVLTLGGAPSLSEGNTGTTPFVFTVSVNNGVQGGFTVTYTTNNNTATIADNDYVDNDNSIIFTGTAGESHMITVQVNGDLNIENNETYTVAVTGVADVPIPGTITISGSPQTGTILNDELDWGDAPTATQSGFAGSYPTLSTDNGARHELFPGDIHLGAAVDADLDGQPNGTATGDGADDDGVTLPTALVINTTANITVNSSLTGYLYAWADFNRDGDWSDPDEQIFSSTALAAGNNNLSFAVPGGATLGNSYMRFRVSQVPDSNVPFGQSLNPGEVEDYAVNIVNTQFSIDDPSVAEGNASTSNLVFNITRTNNANNCSVDYAITGGTATSADNDYQPLAAGTASFTSGGSLTQQVTVVVNGDLKVELNEMVDITLSNPVNASILDGNGTGMIANDDAAVISITSPSMNEGDMGTQNMVFDINMSRTSDANVSFNYATSDGSATEPADYTNTSGSHTMSPGQTMKQVSVPIVGDCTIETNQAFNLLLSSLNPLGRNVTFISGNPTLAGVGTINNEDFPPVIMCPNNTTISCDESTLPAHTGMATATDDCSPSPAVSSTDVITPGICATSYTITRTWKATDGTSDMSTCNQIITVVDNPPIAVCKSITIALDNNGNASITPANVNDGSHDACGSVILVSVVPNSFNCSHTGQNIVTLTVMDQCGNTATCSSTVTITGGPLYKYVIAAKNGSKLEKYNIVHTGGVGVTALTGKAEIKTFSIVTGPGTFVQAKNITVDITSIVTTKIFTPAIIPLPAFLYNTLSTYNSPSINIPDNVTQVITGSVFKKIKVGKNATAIFTNQNIYALEIEVKENATIKFTHCAKIRAKEVELGKNLDFNPDAFDVWLYAEDTEDGIKEGSDIIASIYALDEFKVNAKWYNRTSMTGIFIGKRVDGYEGVDWYANTQCNNGCSIPILPAMIGGEVNNIPASSNDEPHELKIFPNPFNNDFNITLSSPNVQTMNVRIFDISGKLMSESLKVEPNQVFTTGSQLNPGVYFIEVTQGDYRKVMNLIKLK